MTRDEASALIEKFKDKSGIWTGTSKYLIQVIENQPTAYDVEKVIAKLENKDDDCGCGKINVSEAIDIVHNGGKE